MSDPEDAVAPAPPERGRSTGAPARRAAGAMVRLVLVLACFALAGYAVDLLLLDDPSLLRVLLWFAGALLLHDLVLFPLYAGGDRVLAVALKALPRTRVPLVNHIRIPVLGAGLTLLMFLPGIIGQRTATNLAAAGLDQEPYRERWLWLVAALFAVSAGIWLLRTLSPRHRQQMVDGEGQQGLPGQPAADLTPGKQPAGEHQPDPER